MSVGAFHRDSLRVLMTVFSKTIQSDGIFGLYRGLAISFLLTACYRSSYFGLFNTGKTYMFDGSGHNNYLRMWLFALCTTGFSNFVFYPLDTIRRRLMMQAGRTDVLYSGTLD